MDVSKINESILTSIKKLLGVSESCTDFDPDIIIHINTALMILNQLGIGENGYIIEDKENTWDEFVKDTDKFSAIKSYVHLKVKLLFDPPLNAALVEAMQQYIIELEWRLNVRAESDNEEV